MRHESSIADNQSVAVSRRIRHLGLVDTKVESAEKQALDPRRGYVLGRMLLDGKITQIQHEAGLKYAEDMARFYGLTGVPFPSARAQDLFAIRSDGSEDGEERGRAAARARSRAKALQALLLAVGDINTGRKVTHTVNSIALLDIQEARGWPEHMVGWLKRGLNALARHYGMA